MFYLVNLSNSFAVCGKRPTDTGNFINFIAYICRSLGHWYKVWPNFLHSKILDVDCTWVSSAGAKFMLYMV